MVAGAATVAPLEDEGRIGVGACKRVVMMRDMTIAAAAQHESLGAVEQKESKRRSNDVGISPSAPPFVWWVLPAGVVGVASRRLVRSR